LIGNFNFNVGNENAILLTEMESDDDECILFKVCIFFFGTSLKFVLSL